MLQPWPPTHQLLCAQRHDSSPICLCRTSAQGSASTCRPFCPPTICLSSPSNARPASSLIRTVVHFVPGPLGRGRHSWCHQRDHVTSSCCGLVLPQLLPVMGSILRAFTGQHSCPFDETNSEARPDLFSDGFGSCTSKSISNIPPRQTKLITSPSLAMFSPSSFSREMHVVSSGQQGTHCEQR